jgi:uncharacterized protein (TIGR03437 family)
LAVRNGNLYVLDAGNNRILRFVNPLTQPDQFPDLVIGQPNFSSKAAGLSERNLNIGSLRGGLALDTTGNLFVSDSGNRRVLRFAAAALGQGARNGPAADLVLGQADFASNTPVPRGGAQLKDRLASPAGLALDSRGRLFVADYEPTSQPRLGELHRVLVFEPPFSIAEPAVRVMGVLTQAADAATANRVLMALPEAVAVLADDRVVVADTASSRLLIFPPFSAWPDESAAYSPQAASVVGQADFDRRQPNGGRPAPSAATLSTPLALAVSGTDVFIADSGNNRVLAISPPFQTASRTLGQLGFEYDGVNLVEGKEFSFSSGSAAAGGAAGIAIDYRAATPYLYIADTFNNRVLAFRDARTVKSGDRAEFVIGQPDSLRSMCNYPANNIDIPTDSSLCHPSGLALDDDGNLYVADSGNSRVLRFPKPFAQAQSLPRADLVIGQSGFTSKITDASARTMAAPYGVAYARSGLLVSDAALNRVLYFAGAPATLTNGMAATRVFGQPDFVTGAAGAAENRMNTPLHLASDADDRLYVADTGNNRVLIFGRIGQAAVDQRPEIIVTSGSGGAVLRGPRGVFISPATGDIWVIDATRLLRYPRADALTGATPPNFALSTAATGLALAQDPDGGTLVADAANRVAIYYPALTVLNAANFLPGRPLAPGVIASIFSRGAPFSQETRVFNELPEPLPLPLTLADVAVFLNGHPVPLLFVSPNQINFIVPGNAPDVGSADLRVVRQSSGATLAAGPVEMNEVSPALFTLPSTGSGQVALVNEDGTVSGPTNPARRGTVVSIYGTGQGRVQGAPPDGFPATGLSPTDEKPRVLINNVPVSEDAVSFSGLAPGFVGLWQINVRIPETVAPGNAIPLSVQFRGVSANNPQLPGLARTTIAVRP